MAEEEKLRRAISIFGGFKLNLLLLKGFLVSASLCVCVCCVCVLKLCQFLLRLPSDSYCFMAMEVAQTISLALSQPQVKMRDFSYFVILEEEENIHLINCKIAPLLAVSTYSRSTP